MKMLWEKLWKGFTGAVSMPSELPTHAFVLSGGEEHWVETVNVRPGDTLLIYPGERVPVDGVIVEGQSFLEPWEQKGKISLISRGVGDKVYSGSLNRSAQLKIKAVRPAEKSFLQRRLTKAMKREADKAQATSLLQFYRADDVGSLFPGDIFM